MSVFAALGATVAQTSADSSSTTSSSGLPPTTSQILATAERYIGYPYAYIGDDPSTGFSCIGFVHYVFAQNGIYVPEDLGQAYATAPHVDKSNLQPGDLVFFQNTVWDGISHVDLYVGNGRMIGADSFQTGVQEDLLGDPYWRDHYLGATRPLADPSGTPLSPGTTATAASSGPSLAPPSGPSLDLATGTMRVTRHGAAIHSGPGASYSAIDAVSPSSILMVLRTHGQWIDVSYNDGAQFGWILGADTTTAPASAASAATATTPAASPTPAAATPATSAGTPAPRVAAAGVARHDTGKTLTVARAGLPLYTGPAATYPMLNQVGPGTRVTVLRMQGQWDQVALPDGTIGWVGYQYLHGRAAMTAQPIVAPVTHPAGRGQAPARTAVGRTVVVTADALMVRAGPTRHARIVWRLYTGARVRVLAAFDRWDYVIVGDGLHGWVSARYVR